MSKQRATYAALISTSVIVVTYRLLQWRARRRTSKTVDRVKDMVQEGGPLIDYDDKNVRDAIIGKATRRASKWMSLNEKAQPMIGQVGGIANHKKPILTLEPDYILKPLIADFRGVREIAFYEAIRIVTTSSPSSHHHQHGNSKSNSSGSSSTGLNTQIYSTFLRGPPQKRNAIYRLGELFDTLAVAFAIWLQDPVVAASEAALKEAWRSVKREMEAFQKLAKFTAPYYGVIGQPGVCEESEYGISDQAHLLLQDLTANYSQPCVMDLKLGLQTYEPDASEEKRKKEYEKYPEQAQYGFRIIGMRIYSPTHPEADDKGYRHFGKSYGRSLKSKTAAMDAFRLFFSAGVLDSDTFDEGYKNFVTSNNNEGSTINDNARKSNESIALSEDTPEPLRIRALQNTLAQLRPIRRWFDDNRSLRFYASSLLIVYEGDTTKDIGNRDYASIKMIDFGRVRRSSEGDPGYIVGLRNLRNFMTQILDDEQLRLQQKAQKQPSPVSSLNNSAHQ